MVHVCVLLKKILLVTFIFLHIRHIIVVFFNIERKGVRSLNIKLIVFYRLLLIIF